VYHVDDYPFDILADNPAMKNLTALLCHPRSYSGYARRIELEQLQALCESENLPNLKHLRLRLTELGDEGCMMLAESGILKRLKILDLRLGSVTDEGAAALANCPDIHHLELLNLSRNALTEEGIALLDEVGVRLIAEDQHESDDEDDEWYCVGDIE
jgi:Ran GTPase-activating protein (RanGAP) involved in mRNA processing and transport